MEVKVKKLRPEAVIPVYATDGSGAFDLCSAGNYWVSMETSPEIQTGLAFEIPIGHVLLIFSRSGHGFRETIRLANCVGIVDSDYRGEVLVKLVKDQAEGAVNGCVIRPGDRVAQGMVIPIPKIEFEVVDNLNVTVRGADGFGSTGR